VTSANSSAERFDSIDAALQKLTGWPAASPEEKANTLAVIEAAQPVAPALARRISRILRDCPNWNV
jgi:hypothetical protein